MRIDQWLATSNQFPQASTVSMIRVDTPGTGNVAAVDQMRLDTVLPSSEGEGE